MQVEGVFKYVHKIDAEKGGRVWDNADIADKGGRGGWSNVGAKMLITNIPLIPNVNNQSKGPEWSVFYKGW